MQHAPLETINIPAHGADPALHVELRDSAGQTVDLSTGYTGFQAQVARKNALGTSVLNITSGVSGDTTGYVVPADQIAALDPTFDYVLTTTATHTASAQPRRAQAFLVIDAAPVPA